MVIATAGLLMFMVNLAMRKAYLEKSYLMIALSAVIVSLCGVISMWYNETADTAYATYIVSMLVWLGGAYFVVEMMKYTHGRISVIILCNYLIAICALQCIIALAIDISPDVKSFIDRFYSGGEYYAKRDRLYGIGAALDVAGSRFSAVLIMITCIGSIYGKTLGKKWLVFYTVSFMIIAIIGNMISRTTSVGVILSLAYLIYVTMHSDENEGSGSKARLWKWGIAIALVSMPIIVYFYKSDPAFNKNFRFAFEGFFSLVEEGKWDVHSNEMLGNMYRFPDNIKTWTIGDGYFANPSATDPYYIGAMKTDFYMGTDVGYLRFIYYFGIIGLLAFIIFFCNAARLCARHFPEFKKMFFLILAINFIIWFKVATDIFLVFALFLCLPANGQPDLLTDSIKTKQC